MTPTPSREQRRLIRRPGGEIDAHAFFAPITPQIWCSSPKQGAASGSSRLPNWLSLAWVCQMVGRVLWCFVVPTGLRARVWQTDRQMDRRTDGQHWHTKYRALLQQLSIIWRRAYNITAVACQNCATMKMNIESVKCQKSKKELD